MGYWCGVNWQPVLLFKAPARLACTCLFGAYLVLCYHSGGGCGREIEIFFQASYGGSGQRGTSVFASEIMSNVCEVSLAVTY